MHVRCRNGKLSERFLEGNPGTAVVDFAAHDYEPWELRDAVADDLDGYEPRYLHEHPYRRPTGGPRNDNQRTLLLLDPNAEGLILAGVSERDLHEFVARVTGIRPFFVAIPTRNRSDNTPAYINFRTHEQREAACRILHAHPSLPLVVQGQAPI